MGGPVFSVKKVTLHVNIMNGHDEQKALQIHSAASPECSIVLLDIWWGCLDITCRLLRLLDGCTSK